MHPTRKGPWWYCGHQRFVLLLLTCREQIIYMHVPRLAVGDHLFKLDSMWTSRVFLNADPGFQFKSARPEDLIPRILTPPYLSNEPDVRHLKLKAHYPLGSDSETKAESFLILCSDGLVDLYEARDYLMLKRTAEVWMKAASKDGRGSYQEADVYNNRALRILREGLGGEDTDRVAQWVTVEMMSKWLDDITILVVPL
jgi:pyruvate dehydrogenase phosphatase